VGKRVFLLQPGPRSQGGSVLLHLVPALTDHHGTLFRFQVRFRLPLKVSRCYSPLTVEPRLLALPHLLGGSSSASGPTSEPQLHPHCLPLWQWLLGSPLATHWPEGLRCWTGQPPTAGYTWWVKSNLRGDKSSPGLPFFPTVPFLCLGIPSTKVRAWLGHSGALARCQTLFYPG
jgi:hypothetical protein